MEINDDPFVGTWVMVPAESQFDQHHKPSQATMRFVREEDGYVMSAEGVSNSNVIREPPQTFYLDGGEHPVSGAPELSAASTLVDRNTLRVVVRRGDESIGDGLYTVSANGRTLTTTLSGVDSEQRRFQSTVVWRRAEAH